jgi:hypothetical protein
VLEVNQSAGRAEVDVNQDVGGSLGAAFYLGCWLPYGLRVPRSEP